MFLKVVSANSVDPDQTTVCRYAKIGLEKFARIYSRRHKQTTLSDAGFLGALRVSMWKRDFVLYDPLLDEA